MQDRNLSRILSAVLIGFIVLIIGVVLVGNASAEECVPIEAQHYSYVGGPIEGQPTTIPPSDEWQANTTQEPHLNNPNVTWVDEYGVGLHYTSNGSSGLADWFYFQPEVVCTSPTPPPPTTPPPTTPPPTDGGGWTPSWTPTPPQTIGHAGGGTAFTGTDVTVPAVIGGALLLLGLGALYVARRLRQA